jgi:hypothetical protein
VKRGATVLLRVNHPCQLLSQREGWLPGTYMLPGVRRSFRRSKVLPVTIPFGENVNLVIPSSFFSLANATGQALSSSGTVVPLLVPAGQAPPTITLAITGGGK